MSEEAGPLVTQAYVVNEKGAALVLQDITLPPLTATQVELDVTHCGLCHTDIHMRDNDWGVSDYPMVPGHEGIGIIRKVGSACRSLKVGDMVGVTWIRDSCQCCDSCLEGRENLCQEGYQGTYLGLAAGCWGSRSPSNEFGGCFSKVMRVEERFAIKLPDGLPPEVACPLLCGGGTVFECVVDYVSCGTRVAVASIGGLGTAAIKFSKSFGGHVTALSRNENKREGCLASGADAFCSCLGNEEKMAELAGTFDVIIDTSPVNAPIGPYLGMLKFNGTYCRVGLPVASDANFQYDYLSLIFTQKKIAGSVVTGTRRMKRMLQLTNDELLVYEKDPESWKTKVVEFSEVNNVMEELTNGSNTNTWRFILKWPAKQGTTTDWNSADEAKHSL